MSRRLISLLLLITFAFSLAGCSSMYEKEYVHISEYAPVDQGNTIVGDKIVVHNFGGLKQAILSIVHSANGKGTISFESSYEGDALEDMASACWQVRTQDAMCAYCVDNISYEVNRIFSYYEAEISVTYSSIIKASGGIVRMQYATNLDEKLNQIISEGKNKLALLIGRSTYTAEDMKAIVEKLYRANPSMAPHMPAVDVNMFSGTNMQRLYEINLNYDISTSELKSRQREISEVKPFVNYDLRPISPVDKVAMACTYLVENCVYSGDHSANSIYSALVLKEADSEGLSYAFMELCRQLGIKCRMIYGQYNWQDHWWNIVEIAGDYYHVDVSMCMDGDLYQGMLLNDVSIWETHRWDVSAYPACTDELIFTPVETD